MTGVGDEVTTGAFVERLAAQAERRPDALALVDGEERTTYSELVSAVQRRAARLIDAGLRHDDRVALIAENSGRFLEQAFAVWAAGGVLVTIYPSSGPADIDYCIRHSDPVLVITDAATHDRVVAACTVDVPVARMEAEEPLPTLRRSATAAPEEWHGTASLICFTSGSTDRPKGVVHSTSGLVDGLDSYAAMWRLDEHDVMLVCLPMAWLYGLTTTSMGALLRGGTVVVARRANPDLLVELVERHGVTVLPGVTTMFVKLVEYLESATEPHDLSSLRFCVSGGEPRNEAVFDRWTERAALPIHDTYCSSECFPLITYDPRRDPTPRRGSAGRLVPGARLRVVDEHGDNVGVGGTGEAVCTAPGLFLGYWGDPARTVAAFTDDGWFRQQDLVRIDDDGYVHVVGRLSDMIIRGGSNVSPAEVERVLREHPSVTDACVVGLPDERYGQQVVAVVVPSAGSLDVDALDGFVREHLAAYKAPSTYRVADSLPLNSTTGKVDRRRVAADLTPHPT